MGRRLFRGAEIFDGERLCPGSLLVESGKVRSVLPADARLPDVETVDLSGGLLAPGFVDLQVNGGGGLMFNDAPDVATLRVMAEAHARLGSLTILPTLISDTAEITRAAVAAVAQAVAEGVPGIAGIHLEGPHLSPARKGAHDPALIRPITEADLAFLLSAVERMPTLVLTVAPEAIDNEHISALSAAGIRVSLGHSDAGFETCLDAIAAGARMATHLFNAMSPLGSREPGLVGAALTSGAVSAGLIADGIHVHPAVIRAALAAKTGPGGVFLVTDAMAPAGTNMRLFRLNGREIRREAGRLTLADGTLAGADIDMAGALRVVTREVGLPLDRALAMATKLPAQVAGIADRCGVLGPGRPADFIHLSRGLEIEGVWRGGERLV